MVKTLLKRFLCFMIQVSQEWLSARFQPRVSADFVDLQNPEFQPLCGEVDLAGYVVSVTDGQGRSGFCFLIVPVSTR